MLKCFSFSVLAVLIFGCKQAPDKKEGTGTTEKNITTRLYSKAVADSFSIFVNLPAGYDPQKKEKYPVVYLLDANLYFNIVATTVNKYAEVGLAPTVILIGIGYKDFPTMDSLRNRDDTYPVAIPEYEMSVSGGADKFLTFIDSELMPYIDKEYQTDTSKRVLMGHSLGGYFTMYALLQNLSGNSNKFNGYIAASPSIHYNNYYLLNQLKGTAPQKAAHKTTKAYITYGGLEDAGDSSDTSTIRLTALSAQLSELLSKKQSGYMSYKGDIYSNLDHMDTQLPTFVKGLQWVFNED